MPEPALREIKKAENATAAGRRLHLRVAMDSGGRRRRCKSLTPIRHGARRFGNLPLVAA